ncbi:ATP-binding protein [Flavobacterium taihuense]|uniref:DNA binding domain-containing protein n=1 Tax=Flavobacterium taihuense TaxID=2857508 RepID=A0ABS6XU70_9FLAO|nr:ATP-binding protein [Flavobacterium taihuense]MBW4359388.1 putative DNA binding domain-containing protein [Flavobacterium taihuense]
MNIVPISSKNSMITETYLRTQKENQYFERKGLGEKDIKPTKIAEELIGMLNADGGVLVFGVSDNGEFQDLRNLGEKLDGYRTLIFDFIQPACNIEIEEVEVNGNLILLFHVEQELERIFCRKDNEDVFLRVLDTNRKLNRDRIKKLEYDKSIRRFEEEIVNDLDFADLDQDLLKEYRAKLNYNGEVLDLLTKRYLAKKNENGYALKNASVLLFSKDPEKYIPSASVRYIRYDGVVALTGVNHNVVKDERFENNIPKLINELRVFLKASFRDYYFLDMEDGKFRKVPEYPEEAWLEGVVNAMCHRSYNVQGSAIYIKHFNDRLEISNSGPLPSQVTIQNIKTERFARNPRIARVLEDMGYVRQLNEGVSRIYESMEKSMLSIPEYKEENGNVYLILRNKISEHSKTIHDSVIEKIEKNWEWYNVTQRSIFNYLFLNHQATIDELTKFTAININTIRTYVNKFQEEGLLDRISEKQRDKNAIYMFKKH